MKVNIEVQHICTPNLRGIPYYIINLVDALVKRGENEYSASFFDFQKERNNRAYVEDYLSSAISRGLRLEECNSLSYKAFTDGYLTGDISSYANKQYSEYFSDEADVYHFPHVWSIPQNCQKNMIVTVHDILPVIPEFSYGWKSSVGESFLNSLKYLRDRKDIQVVADSAWTKKDLVDRINISEDRIHVVPLAYDKAIHYVDKDMSVLRDMQIDGSYVLYLGALDFRKGVVDILDAFEIIKETNRDIKLVLAGKLDKSVTPIWDKLNNYKYIDDVILTGFVNDTQKRVLLSCAEAFLFPSEYEGFGLPVLEAMACGTPVITTNVSSLPEVGGDAVLYVSPKNPEELSVAINKILLSEELRKDYIARGFERIKQFSWDKTAEMTEAVYKI